MIIALLVTLSPLSSTHAAEMTGKASYYTVRSCELEQAHPTGLTSIGERFDETKMTAAMRISKKELRSGIYARITNLKNHKVLIVRVNDYGPSKKLRNRIIDLTPAAFKALGGSLSQGLIDVKVEIMERGKP